MSKKVRRNDKGKVVPDNCPKYGSKIYVYLKGEPIYQCSNKNCHKFFGVLPCNESVDIFLHEYNVGNMLPQVDVDPPIIKKDSSTETGKLIDYIDEIDLENEYRTESAVMKRSKLPDDVFGIPELRKYPMPTRKYTISAIKLFNHVSPKYEEELAKNIIKNMKKYKISKDIIGEKNRLNKYI